MKAEHYTGSLKRKCPGFWCLIYQKIIDEILTMMLVLECQHWLSFDPCHIHCCSDYWCAVFCSMCI